MTKVFTTPDRVITGRGCIRSLGDEARRLGSGALVVTGRTALRKSGTTERIQKILEDAGMRVVLFEKVPPEPDLESVDGARRALRENSCDLVVAAGGGSAMDAGKAAAALAREKEPAHAYFYGKDVTKEGLPCIAIATTSGTGAEATENSVLSDPEGKVKASIRTPGIMPRVAMVDPELTLSVPPGVTASAGMDALTQAIESFVSIHASPITDALACDAVELLSWSVLRCFKEPTDIDAREAASYGSLMAGIALANARLGAVHGMAHPVGVRYHIPHGVVCSVLLPPVLEMNRPSAPKKYAALDRIFGQDSVRFVKNLQMELGLPETFRDYHVSRRDFDAIALESMKSGSLKANPKKMTPADVKAILGKVC